MEGFSSGLLIIFLFVSIVPCTNAIRRRNIEPTYPPTFVITPPLFVYAKPDEPLILPCHVDAMPAPNYQWLVDGKEANWIKPFYHVNSRTPTVHSMGLQTKWRNYSEGHPESSSHPRGEHTHWYIGQIGVTMEFKPGVYQCTAWNNYGRAISSPVHVRMARLGIIQDHQEQRVTIQAGEPIRLNCSVTSSEPTATIRWMLRAEDGSVEFVRENRTLATDDNGNLHLMQPLYNNHQIFVCAVNNAILRTIKTGPDVHVYSLNQTDERWPIGRNRPWLVYHSARDSIALVNHSLTLRCLIAGYPLPITVWQWRESNAAGQHQLSLAWKEEGSVFREVDQLPSSFGVYVRNDGTQLFIPSVKSRNAGTYRCLAKLQRGTESASLLPMSSFKVIVEGEPTFAIQPKDTIVPVFGTAIMHCAVDEEATQPPAQVMWLLNGGPIDPYLDGRRRLRRFDDLYIHNATTEDIAVFQCQISNVHGRRVANAYLHVWQQPPAILWAMPEEQLAAEGQSTTLPCRTMGAPKASIQWYRNGTSLHVAEQWADGTPSKYRLTSDGGLHIERVTMLDGGKYTCIATNRYGDSQATGSLVVRGRTRITAGPRLVLSQANHLADNQYHGPHPPHQQQQEQQHQQQIQLKQLQQSNRKNHVDDSSGLSNGTENHIEQVIENTLVWLRCDVNADPLEVNYLRMAWKKDNEHLLVGTLKSNGRLSLSADGTALQIAETSPSDSGIYTCSAYSRLDSDNSSMWLIVQGKPAAPRLLTLTCSDTSPLAPFAHLQWQLGPYNNPPVEQAVIEFVAGTYRPVAPNLSHYHEQLDHQENQPSLSGYPENTTVREELLKSIWMKEAIPRAKQLAKKLIFTNRWSRIPPVPFSVVETHVGSQQLARADRNGPELSPSKEVDQAFVRLYADAVYHFRVRLVNRIGQSEPSVIVPELDGHSICHLPPKPVVAVPNQMFVYGTQPHNLRIRFTPLPPIEHNGPGLIYKLLITCLDCQIGPNKPMANLTMITDWSVGDLEIQQLTTREIIGPGQYERVQHWQIETFRTYEVNLTTENMFGSLVRVPLVQTGQSGEGIPTVILDAPKPIFVTAQNVTLAWRLLTRTEIDQKILGHFRGFRVEWCEAHLTEELCNFYKVYQDYVVRIPPVWSVPELRTSGKTQRRSSTASPEVEDRGNKNDAVTDSLSLPHTAETTVIRPQKINHGRQRANNSFIAIINGSYVAVLAGLPGRTRIRAWLRVLNIQYCGPASDPVTFITKEGVPEAVPEIVATFVGVTHVELSWVKPLKTNGDLVAYDLEVRQVPKTSHSKSYSADQTVKLPSSKSERKNPRIHEVEVKRRTVNDPEQLATRISGLRMNTEYDITIWSRTKAGRGEKAELRIRTAQLTQNADISPFLISSIPNSPNSVNVCLAHSLNFPASKPPPSEIRTDRGVTQSHDLPIAVTPDPEAIHGRWQNEQVFQPAHKISSISTRPIVQNLSSPSSFPNVDSDMFYAQFRTVGDEYWEETQREFQKPWIVLSNLLPNHEYEIRVVIVTASGESTVSQSKVIRLPTSPESWFSSASVLSRFGRFQSTTLFIGSACAFILLLSSMVAVLFLACWCRRRHQHRNHADCPLPSTATASIGAASTRSRPHSRRRPPAATGKTMHTYDSLKESNQANRPRLIEARDFAPRQTVDPSVISSIHTASPDDPNIPDVFQPNLTGCVWMDRVLDDNEKTANCMKSLQLGPDLTQSLLLGKCPSNEFELYTRLPIPLTEVTHAPISSEPGLQTITSRTFKL